MTTRGAIHRTINFNKKRRAGSLRNVRSTRVHLTGVALSFNYLQNVRGRKLSSKRVRAPSKISVGRFNCTLIMKAPGAPSPRHRAIETPPRDALVLDFRRADLSIASWHLLHILQSNPFPATSFLLFFPLDPTSSRTPESKAHFVFHSSRSPLVVGPFGSKGRSAPFDRQRYTSTGLIASTADPVNPIPRAITSGEQAGKPVDKGIRGPTGPDRSKKRVD